MLFRPVVPPPQNWRYISRDDAPNAPVRSDNPLLRKAGFLESSVAAECIDRINAWLSEEYGKYYEPPTRQQLQGYLTKLQIKPSRYSELRSFGQEPERRALFFGRRNRGYEVLALAVMLAKDEVAWDSLNVPNDLLECLVGKRVIVLGDDVGSLSQVLSSKFCCHAVGIESDPVKVALGLSGLHNPKGRSCLTVRQGNYWDLLNPLSSLASRVVRQGKVDAILSTSFFQFGAGFDFIPFSAALATSIRNRELLSGTIKNGRSELIDHWLRGSQHLLTPEGIQLHLGVDYLPRAGTTHTELMAVKSGSVNHLEVEKGFVVVPQVAASQGD